MINLLENEKYNQAIKEIEKLANSDSDNKSNNNSTKAPKIRNVEITLDNWQDYFELRTYHKFEENGFGETEYRFSYNSLVSKDSLIPDIDKSSVTIEFTVTPEYKYSTVDLENKTIIYGETYSTVTNPARIDTLGGVGQYIGENSNDRYGLYLYSTDVIIDFTVIRIQGSFCYTTND